MKKLLVLPALLLGVAFAQDQIRWDGSSTVYPISLAIAEEFQIVNPGAQLTVAFSGTGAGFEKFCRGETDVTGASRPIKQSEVDACAENGIEFVELPIAADGLSVVVNPANDWVECLTVDELKAMWEPGSQINNWSQVRDGFPDAPIEYYGAGTDSGTFDYFTEAINGESGAIRTDFFPSEDDNVLVQGVAGNENAIAFFGYAYYVANQDQLKLVEVDGGNGCVAPSEETIANNTYVPLSRPLFEYFNVERLESNPTLLELAEFALSEEARPAIEETGYLAYPDEIYEAAAQRLADRVTGSSFLDFKPGQSVLDAVSSAAGE
jgi:phosphate transport system substrate-binding protein